MSKVKTTTNSIDFQFTVDKKNYYLYKMPIFRFWIIGILMTSFSLVGIWESLRAVSELQIVKQYLSALEFKIVLPQDKTQIVEKSNPFSLKEINSSSPIPFTSTLDSNYNINLFEVSVLSQFINPIENKVWAGDATVILAIESKLEINTPTQYLDYGSENTTSDFGLAVESAKYKKFRFQYLVNHTYKFTIPKEYRNDSNYTISAILVAKINDTLHYGNIIEL